jgi:hypothetical protein
VLDVRRGFMEKRSPTMAELHTTKDIGHWRYEDFKQRMSVAQWRKLLLEEDDTVIYRGRVRKLKAEHIGFGVVEVSKVPQEADNGPERT